MGLNPQNCTIRGMLRDPNRGHAPRYRATALAPYLSLLFNI